MRILFAPEGKGGGFGAAHAKALAFGGGSDAPAAVETSAPAADAAPAAVETSAPAADAPAAEVAPETTDAQPAPETDPPVAASPGAQAAPAAKPNPFEGVPPAVQQFMARQMREVAELKRQLTERANTPSQESELVKFLREQREEQRAAAEAAAKKAAIPQRPEFDDPLEGELWDLKQQLAAERAERAEALKGFETKHGELAAWKAQQEHLRAVEQYKADYTAQWQAALERFPLAQHSPDGVSRLVSAGKSIGEAAKIEHDRLNAVWAKHAPVVAKPNTPAQPALQRGPAPSAVPALPAPGTAATAVRPKVTNLEQARARALTF